MPINERHNRRQDEQTYGSGRGQTYGIPQSGARGAQNRYDRMRPLTSTPDDNETFYKKHPDLRKYGDQTSSANDAAQTPEDRGIPIREIREDSTKQKRGPKRSFDSI